MARKSSFLQGFEVGSDLYNKGFSQAATMRQMSMQEARDKAAAERHKADMQVRKDLFEFQKKKFEHEIAEEKRQRDEVRADAQSLKDFASEVGVLQLDYSQPADVEFLKNMSIDQMARLKTQNGRTQFKSYLDAVNEGQGARLMELADWERKVGVQFNVKAKLDEQSAKRAAVSKFNMEFGTNFQATPEGAAEAMKWRRMIAMEKRRVAETGEFDLDKFIDFGGFDDVANELSSEADIWKAKREQTQSDLAAKNLNELTQFTQKENIKSAIELREEQMKAAIERQQLKAGGLNDVQRELILDQTNLLRKEPILKNAQAAQANFDGIKRIVESGRGSAPDDIAMIFQFMKTLDPGSVVREGEFQTAQDATGAWGRTVNYVNNLAKGTRLSDEQRKEFLDTVESTMGGLTFKAHQVVDSYEQTIFKQGIENYTYDDIRSIIGNRPMLDKIYETKEALKRAVSAGEVNPERYNYSYRDGAGNLHKVELKKKGEEKKEEE